MIIYKDNEQIITEIKKLLLEAHITQRELSERLGIKPQGLSKLLSKKNFGFNDAKRIVNALGYELEVGFEKCPGEEI